MDLAPDRARHLQEVVERMHQQAAKAAVRDEQRHERRRLALLAEIALEKAVDFNAGGPDPAQGLRAWATSLARPHDALADAGLREEFARRVEALEQLAGDDPVSRTALGVLQLVACGAAAEDFLDALLATAAAPDQVEIRLRLTELTRRVLDGRMPAAALQAQSFDGEEAVPPCSPAEVPIAATPPGPGSAEARVPDGPYEEGLCGWAGVPHPVPAVQWRLLKVLWGKRRVSVDRVLQFVYGEDEGEGKLKSLIHALKGTLAREGIPFVPQQYAQGTKVRLLRSHLS
jgi:hypothetical protein